MFLDLTSVSSSVVANLFCLFGHSNRLLATLRRDLKKQHAASHTGELKSESVALKAELCAACDFSGKVAPDTRVVILQGFHQWAIGSVTIALPHSPIDCGLTDIYLNENP